MPEPLAVAHVVLSLDCGGLERLVLDLVRQGQTLGQRPSVVCLERPGTLAPQAEALGARLACVCKQPGVDRPATARLRRVLQELRPQVVHTHQAGALYYVGPAARGARVPLVVHTEHGNHLRRLDSGFWTYQRKAWLWWLAARHARRFFCVSREIAGELAARRIVPANKLHVLANGIATARFAAVTDTAAVRRALGIAPEAPLIGTVGRLNELKCQDLLLRAFAEIKPQCQAAELLFVGDGPLRGSLSELANQLGIGSAVHFAGYQADPVPYLQALDVFALTSRTEGMPLAILEAWAAGCPVVASAVGGVPDVVDHDRTGLLFPSGDVTALTRLLTGLLANPGLRRRLSEAGRQEVNARFDLQHMAAAYAQHYQELLGKGDGTRCAS